MSTWGMDISAVRQLAQHMNNQADAIQQIMGTLTNSLNSTPWVGPDHDHFLSEWQGTHCAQLNSVINGLHDASQKAMVNAQQQEQASQS